MRFLKLVFSTIIIALVLFNNAFASGKNISCDSGYVKINNVDVFYKIYGKGKPVVMLHGYSVDHRIMMGAMEPIFKEKKGYKRIYFDLPGMGKTKNYESIQNADQALQLVLDFIDLKIPDQKFILTGLSYGGYLSRGVINKRPEMVDGYLLICPLGNPEQAKRKLPVQQTIIKDEEFVSSLNDQETNILNSLFVVQSKSMWNRFQSEVMPSLQIADYAFLEKYRTNGYSFSFEVDKLDKPYNKPALFLFGKQDGVVGYEDFWDIMPNYPRASYVVLDIAGHNLYIEQESLFNTLVNEFLGRMKK